MDQTSKLIEILTDRYNTKHTANDKQACKAILKQIKAARKLNHKELSERLYILTGNF